jgi:glycosyltransferase involved in cell wall biosynthesis
MYPKISVVTPSYNQGQFIEDNIKSVLEQNYPNVEHIIVDNCSSDQTIDVLKRYPHLKWITQPDKGQSDALNKGFKMATGDIIGWLNADDYYLPETFKKVKIEFSNNSIDGIYSNLMFVDRDKKFIRYLRSHKAVKWLSLFHCFIPSATFFFRRKIVDYGINIDPKYHITMDKEFFANILHSNFNLVFIDDCYAAFRWHNSNKSLDTDRIKKIRYSEGLSILNKYSSIKVPINDSFVFLYMIAGNILLIYRVILKYNYPR